MLGSTKFRYDIQILRGTAVLAVILFHAFPFYFPGGYLGVDLFFVISGFVVSPLILRAFQFQNHQELKTNLREFYKRRFYRLGPALGITIIAFTPLLFLLGNLNDHERFYKQGISTMFLLGNFGASNFSGDYFNPRPNPLLHTWSLSAEEQIYLILPILIFLISRFRRIKVKGITYLSILLMINVSVLLLWLLSPEIVNFYSPFFRLFEFSIGAFAYHFVNRVLIAGHKVLLALSLILVTWLLFFDQIENRMLSGIVASFLVVTVIFSNDVKSSYGKLGEFLSWFGDRSYSLYLVHMPIIYLANFSPFIEFQSPNRKLLLNIAAFSLAILAGAIQYKFVEQKFRIRRESMNSQQISFPKAFSISMVIPVIMLASGLFAFHNMYFGLRHENPPPYAGITLTKICESNQDRGSNLCTLGLEGRREIIYLIGDSHAAHLSHPLIKIATERKWGFIYSDAVDIESIRRLQEQGKVVHLVYSQYWHTELLSPYQLNIEAMKKLKVPLIVVGQSPTYPDETLFMNQRSVLNGLYIAPKKYEISKLKQEDLESGARLILFLNASRVDYINPMDYFCDEKFCYRWSSLGWLYFDDDHFSRLGAMKLYKPFVDAL